MNERILVPIDDSDPSWDALREALEMFGSKEITVLHVLELDDMTPGVMGPAAEELEETRESEARELFDEAQSVADDYGVTLGEITAKGEAAEAIVEAVDATDADHIVMGSHGRSGLARVLLGSVAESVIRDAPVSVTISRPNAPTDG